MPRVPVFAHSASASSVPVNAAPDFLEPMQLGLMRLSLTSGGKVTFACIVERLACPANMHKCLSISSANLPPLSASATHLALPISFQLPGGAITVTTIIDSGACSCFIDLAFTAQLWPKTQGLSVYLADGSCIKSGLVPPLPVVSPTNHKVLLSLDAISSPLFPVILGLPWLQTHNPRVD